MKRLIDKVLNSLNGTGGSSPFSTLTQYTPFGTYMDGWIGAFRKSAKARITVPDTGAGGTDALSTVILTDLEDQPVDSAKVFLIIGSTSQYNPRATPSSTVGFATPTKGSIIDSGQGYALVKSDEFGEFACTITNSADETVYFHCEPATTGVPDSDLDGDTTLVSVASNSDEATWS